MTGLLPGQTVIHLTCKSGSRWIVPCQGKMMYTIHGVQQNHPLGSAVTGDPKAVNCPQCMKSEEFNEALAKLPR